MHRNIHRFMCKWVFMKQNTNQRTLKLLQGWVVKCEAIPEANCGTFT